MLDLIIAISILIFAIIGYHRGFFDQITGLMSTVLALVLSLIVYPVINMLIKASPIYMKIFNWTLSKVEPIDFGSGVQSQGEAILENIKWLPTFIVEQIKNNNNTALYEVLGASTITEYISYFITNIIIALISILITWIILKVMLRILLKGTGKVIKQIPVVSGINQVGGLCIGLIKGLITLSIIGLMIPLVTMIPTFSQLEEYIEVSKIASWLYENNIILLLYKQIMNL